MRKIFVVFFLISWPVITACGGKDTVTQNEQETDKRADQQENEEAVSTEKGEPEPAGKSETEEETEEVTETEVTDAFNSITKVEDLMLEVQQAMADVTSMSIDIQSERDVSDNGTKSHNFTAIAGEISFKEPFAFHQTIVIEGDGGPASEIEMYQTKDKMYMRDFISGQWLAIPMEADMQKDVSTVDPTKQLAGIDSLDDAFSLTEDDKEYVLTYTGSAADFETLINEAVQLNEDPASKQYFDHDLESFDFVGDYQITVDKDTFYLTTIFLEYESVLETEQGKTTVQEKLEMHYDNFNEHDEIVVPEEVTKNAQSFGE